MNPVAPVTPTRVTCSAGRWTLHKVKERGRGAG